MKTSKSPQMSRQMRITKLAELLPICPFVDFKEGSYRMLFPYPYTKDYVKIDNKGRVRTYFHDGVLVNEVHLPQDDNQDEIRMLGEKFYSINRRINYLHNRYCAQRQKYVTGRHHKGKSREHY